MAKANKLYQEIVLPIRSALQMARRQCKLDCTKELKLILGVSGGTDSMVMAHVLLGLRDQLKLNLIIAHVNHGFRQESDQEEAFVKNFSESNKVAFLVNKAPNLPAKVNLEAWARQLRYTWFDQLLIDQDGHFVITAHHRDDQAETLLQRILSGRAQTRVGTIEAFSPDKKLLRPLITVSKTAIYEYCRENLLAYVEDASNNDLSLQRNYLRHNLIPQITERINPSLSESLAIFSQRIGEEEGYLWQIAAQTWHNADDIVLMPPPIAWRSLYLKAVSVLGDEAQALSYRSLQKCLSAVAQNRIPQKGWELENKVFCSYRKEDGFIFSRHLESPDKAISCRKLSVPGSVQLNNHIIRAELVDAKMLAEIKAKVLSRELSARDEAAYFDADLLNSLDLCVTVRGEGDNMSIFARGRRKIKKLMQENKIPLAERATYPIIRQEQEILWLPLIARSSLAPISTKTKSILIISFQKLTSLD
ncbi:MAG: tRNA lysidine(34) synthetase TilS [Deltaproteobacteria bacterium]|nr:tRNA lysidine(34) synthetase TilS [Deltaproteobacteria bacterium]